MELRTELTTRPQGLVLGTQHHELVPPTSSSVCFFPLCSLCELASCFLLWVMWEEDMGQMPQLSNYTGDRKLDNSGKESFLLG